MLAPWPYGGTLDLGDLHLHAGDDLAGVSLSVETKFALPPPSAF
jgi:hypothetical protein